MTNWLAELLKTLEKEWYEDKVTQHDKFGTLGRIEDALNQVPEEFAVEDRRRCFYGSCNIMGPEDGMQFMLGTHEVRFSKVEFCIITGLLFEVVPNMTRYHTMDNGIHQWYFAGMEEISFAELTVVLSCGEFQQAYDNVKLCLIYMLNWILMGLDERVKIPVWQLRLVEDLDAFDVFPWGAQVYSHSVYSFKHALDGRRERFERRQ
ncbi:hypothetical protein Ddye_008220 [Dipteronia dyeriana]|uniref:DUF1985 domain-containing protein n=1 Tax=Dipteronia dyeriana TaxID=168575 RepID=A0AAE0CLP6_9ROSI|nr:hypothetical protein Ddye_008220 [Dipteronia dyeriana]